MTLHIEPTVKFPQGDKRKIQFQIVDEDGDPEDTTDYEIEWVLQDTRTREEVLSTDDTGVSIDARDDYIGKFDILLETDATDDLTPSDYREVLQITDTDGDQTTWVGEVVLMESL